MYFESSKPDGLANREGVCAKTRGGQSQINSTWSCLALNSAVDSSFSPQCVLFSLAFCRTVFLLPCVLFCLSFVHIPEMEYNRLSAPLPNELYRDLFPEMQDWSEVIR